MLTTSYMGIWAFLLFMAAHFPRMLGCAKTTTGKVQSQTGMWSPDRDLTHRLAFSEAGLEPQYDQGEESLLPSHTQAARLSRLRLMPISHVHKVKRHHKKTIYGHCTVTKSIGMGLRVHKTPNRQTGTPVQ